MSDFTRFMKGNQKVFANEKYAPTASLCDEQGKPLVWEFKHLTTSETNAIRDDCTVQVPIEGKKGVYTTALDSTEFVNRLITESTVYPDLNNASLQDSYGVNTPEKLLLAMVNRPGEYNDLAAFISDMQGSGEDINDLVKKAKN